MLKRFFKIISGVLLLIYYAVNYVVGICFIHSIQYYIISNKKWQRILKEIYKNFVNKSKEHCNVD